MNSLEISQFSEQFKSLGFFKKLVITPKFFYAEKLYTEKNYKEALQAYRNICEILKSDFGDDHLIVVLMKHLIAECLYLDNNFNDGLDAYMEIIQHEKEKLGEEHTLTVSSKHSVSICLMNQKHFEESLTLSQEVLKLEVKLYGEEHAWTLATRYNIAYCQQNLKQYEIAIDIYKALLPVLKSSLGETDLLVLLTTVNIGTCHSMLRHYDHKIYEDLLESLSQFALTKDNFFILSLKQQLGNSFQIQDKFQEAVDIHRNIYSLLDQDNEEIKILTLSTMYNIGYCFLRLKEYQKSIEMFLLLNSKLNISIEVPEDLDGLTNSQIKKLCKNMFEKLSNVLQPIFGYIDIDLYFKTTDLPEDDISCWCL